MPATIPDPSTSCLLRGCFSAGPLHTAVELDPVPLCFSCLLIVVLLWVSILLVRAGGGDAGEPVPVNVTVSPRKSTLVAEGRSHSLSRNKHPNLLVNVKTYKV